MPGLSIRPATPADIPAITRIYAHAVLHGTASFELEPPDEAEMARRQTDAARRRLSLCRRRDRRHCRRLRLCRALSPARRPIASASRIRSISLPTPIAAASGAALLARLIAECEARGYRQMIAVIGDSDQHALDRAAPRRRLPHGRHAADGRLQVRPLARYGPDAARLGAFSSEVESGSPQKTRQLKESGP